jgi:hypothetical protein
MPLRLRETSLRERRMLRHSHLAPKYTESED